MVWGRRLLTAAVLFISCLFFFISVRTSPTSLTTCPTCTPFNSRPAWDKRLLYLSADPLLELDEVRIFQQLGYCVLSTSMVLTSANPMPAASIRCKLLSELYFSLPTANFTQGLPLHLSKQLLDFFDVIVIVHDVRYLECYWQLLAGRHIIFRSIGQSWHFEKRIARFFPWVYVVRSSPRENLNPNYAGEDAVIRFGVDATDFLPWVGDRKIVARDQQEFTQWEEIFTRRETAAIHNISRSMQRELYRRARVYYAEDSVTTYKQDFVEAWLTGTPVVTAPRNANIPFEAPYLVQDGLSGFVAKDLDDARQKIQLLLENIGVAAKISAVGRGAAIELFDSQKIEHLWRTYLQLWDKPKKQWDNLAASINFFNEVVDSFDPPLTSMKAEMDAIDRLLELAPTHRCTLTWFGNCDAITFVDGCWPACAELLPKSYCLVYSFGINNEWSFDDAVASNDSSCVVFAFDPSMNSTQHIRGEKIYFFPEGLAGGSVVTSAGWQLSSLSAYLKRFGHHFLDYLKIDTEGAEWNALENLFDVSILSTQVAQLGIEAHFWAQEANVTGLKDFAHEIDLRSQQMTTLQARVYRRILRRLRNGGFSLQWIHTNPYGPVTNANRRCCYEMLFVNMRFIK